MSVSHDNWEKKGLKEQTDGKKNNMGKRGGCPCRDQLLIISDFICTAASGKNDSAVGVMQEGKKKRSYNEGRKGHLYTPFD